MTKYEATEQASPAQALKPVMGGNNTSKEKAPTDRERAGAFLHF